MKGGESPGSRGGGSRGKVAFFRRRKWEEEKIVYLSEEKGGQFNPQMIRGEDTEESEIGFSNVEEGIAFF